mmetsp:Transcript_7187/g.22998  ORF Transcript_7187/g.22998 Transcript_7187/m.22998 type:complete len:385 (-) Transcript_7187:105-1259(-)
MGNGQWPAQTAPTAGAARCSLPGRRLSAAAAVSSLELCFHSGLVKAAGRASFAFADRAPRPRCNLRVDVLPDALDQAHHLGGEPDLARGDAGGEQLLASLCPRVDGVAVHQREHARQLLDPLVQVVALARHCGEQEREGDGRVPRLPERLAQLLVLVKDLQCGGVVAGEDAHLVHRVECPLLRQQPHVATHVLEELEGLRHGARLAKGADQLVVRPVVWPPLHLVHVLPQPHHNLEHVRGEVVWHLALPHPAHRNRAAADEHLVHGVTRHLPLDLHLLEGAERLRELSGAEVVVDDGRVRGHQPEVEPLRHPLEVLGEPVHPARKGRHVRSRLQRRLGRGGSRARHARRVVPRLAHDAAVCPPHLCKALRRVGPTALVGAVGER